MGLTSSVPNSILQPGVCTSSTRPASPYEGQVIYETDTNNSYIYDSSAWVRYVAAAGVPIWLNGQTISSDYTIPTGYNGMSAGPITIADGVTVTVSNGSEWSIV
jgi:hypothetical protein